MGSGKSYEIMKHILISERLFDDIKMSEVKLSEMLILLRNKIEKSKSFFVLK